MERSLTNQPEPQVSTMVRGSCGECRHSRLGIQGMFTNPHLFCAAHPPQPQVLPGKMPGEMQLMALFPIVDRNASCGEFTPSQKANGA